MTTHFFLGANSGDGFQSLFAEFCQPDEFEDLMILKGGSGCGKSTFMKRLGRELEERGEIVEYLHCSGDPDSLDGVWFPQLRVGAVDGTSPHVIEPRYPAAVDRYINLGQFYHIEAAKESRKEVIHHSDRCKAAYARAYRAMNAARQMEDSLHELVAEGLDCGRLLRRTEGIVRRELHGRGEGGWDKRRFLGSVTYQGGVWRFDTVATLCPRVYQLQDSYGLAAPMLAALRQAAHHRGYACIQCPDPEHTGRLHHLLIPDLGLAFVTSREGMEYSGSSYRRIRLDAMVPAAIYRNYKTRIRFLERMAGLLRQEAVEALQEAHAAHDSLELVYRPHVDFDGLEELTGRELERLLSVRRKPTDLA